MIHERTAANPITAEIIRNSLVAITDEMKTNLMRTAYNPIIYEALDYTVGLFDADGNAMSVGMGLPMFIRGLSDCIKAKLDHFGRDGIHPGDVLLTNDAYITGSHLNHMVFTLPIFDGERLVAFSSTMAHWQDVGGVLSGRTRDIFSEGLQMPIVKIFKAGKQDEELTAIIRMNVRLPKLAIGDFRAQIAAIRTGERRFGALLRRYGTETVFANVVALNDQAEMLAKAAVRAIPDGVYEAESFMDDDGVTAEPLRIKVKVTVSADEMEVDLTDVHAQVAGYFNSGTTAGHSAAQVAFKCLTTPTFYPVNEGAFRSLSVILPPGRIVSAVKPAAMRRWMTVPMTVVDTIFRAMAQAIPETTIAGHYADLCNPTIFGVNPKNGQFFVRMVTIPGGGWGAKHNGDGECGTVCINDGDTHNAPIEATEVHLPILVERYALRPDSGGPGKYRGGLGVELRVRAMCPMNMNIHAERTKCAPWGLRGGLAALPNRVSLVQQNTPRALPNGKLDAELLETGDVFVVETGGGGGFGDPRARSRELVRRDVRADYVTREAAQRDYGLENDA